MKNFAIHWQFRNPLTISQSIYNFAIHLQICNPFTNSQSIFTNSQSIFTNLQSIYNFAIHLQFRNPFKLRSTTEQMPALVFFHSECHSWYLFSAMLSGCSLESQAPNPTYPISLLRTKTERRVPSSVCLSVRFFVCARLSVCLFV
jgi:hypothetical protein